MIQNKKFIMQEGENKSSKTFTVTNGLQQGTVTSPILFNIYTAALLNLFELNTENLKAIAFADDIIIYYSNKDSTKIQNTLKSLFEKINNYYTNWKLKINTTKCETILFRPNLKYTSNDTKRNWRKFQLKESSNSSTIIPHKQTVKYLGITVDTQLKYFTHIDTQLTKAKIIFKTLSRLFLSKHLNNKVKVLCYTAIIRPILTYACPIWHNIPNYKMEEMRIFERQCLRICLNLRKTPESNYKKNYKNIIILNKANIQRIDSFIIKVCGNYFAKTTTSPLLRELTQKIKSNTIYITNALNTGFTPPEIFPYLDKTGYITDSNNIPIIYHAQRGHNSKAIRFNPQNNTNTETNSLKYCTQIPDKDKLQNPKSNKKYWWLITQNKSTQ
ncbi:RNA-directed DNA polymerase from mobile element jockey [Anthophora plagiata]